LALPIYRAARATYGTNSRLFIKIVLICPTGLAQCGPHFAIRFINELSSGSAMDDLDDLMNSRSILNWELLLSVNIL
jgi:hypothetical protein